MHQIPMTRRHVLTSFVALVGGLIVDSAPYAQVPRPTGWPQRPVKVLVPSTAGSQTDLFARLVVEKLGRIYGQPFVVDNKPGGSGVIATQQVTKAVPDGYTLLFTAASFSVVPSALNPQQPYDLQRDLIPVVQIGAGGQFLAVAPESPIKTAHDLFEAARTQPDRLSYGTTGIGSVTHILMAALLRRTGVRMTHVPYKRT